MEMHTQAQTNQYFNNVRMTMTDDKTTAALSLYCNFDTEQARDAWFEKHVQPQILPKGGPIYSWSTKDEGDLSDLNTELLEALVLMTQCHRQPHDKEGKEAMQKAQAAIKKARGNNG